MSLLQLQLNLLASLNSVHPLQLIVSLLQPQLNLQASLSSVRPQRLIGSLLRPQLNLQANLYSVHPLQLIVSLLRPQVKLNLVSPRRKSAVLGAEQKLEVLPRQTLLLSKLDWGLREDFPKRLLMDFRLKLECYSVLMQLLPAMD